MGEDIVMSDDEMTIGEKSPSTAVGHPLRPQSKGIHPGSPTHGRPGMRERRLEL